MWQFAVGRGAALRSGLPVSFDLSFYDGSPTDIDGRFSRKLEIERTFGIELDRADDASISLYKRVFYRHNDRHSRHIFDARVQGGGRMNIATSAATTRTSATSTGRATSCATYLRFASPRRRARTPTC